jgi:hypothetical protein
MILSPPPDSVIVAVFLFSVVGGILAFAVTVLLEAAVFYFLGWAGKWGSLLLSLLVNLVSTVLGWIPAIFGLVSLDGLRESLLPWIVLCVLSTMIEGTLCMLQVKRVGEALQGSLIANVASYLLLMLFYMLISG